MPGKSHGKDFPGSTVVKNPPANAGDMGLGGLQELVMDREAWRAAVHGVGCKESDVTELNWHIYL